MLEIVEFERSGFPEIPAFIGQCASAGFFGLVMLIVTLIHFVDFLQLETRTDFFWLILSSFS